LREESNRPVFSFHTSKLKVIKLTLQSVSRIKS